jgi:hypothetical protein
VLKPLIFVLLEHRPFPTSVKVDSLPSTAAINKLNTANEIVMAALVPISSTAEVNVDRAGHNNVRVVLDQLQKRVLSSQRSIDVVQL